MIIGLYRDVVVKLVKGDHQAVDRPKGLYRDVWGLGFPTTRGPFWGGVPKSGLLRGGPAISGTYHICVSVVAL